MLLTASLIVRNEERFLGACLASLKNLVDEAVIVDTGSTDRSREIARDAGARVEESAWTGDFSAARNRALDLARGEWILYIDADEVARPGSIPEVRAQLAASETFGYYVNLHPQPGYTPYRILRLFRNDPSIRFRGIIHENLWPSILERHRESDAGMSPLTLDHYGYEGDQRAKHARNLPLLHRALREDPYAIFPWCHLADIYLALGRPRFARRALESAIAVVRARKTPAQGDYLPYTRLIPLLEDSGVDASEITREAIGQFPGNAQLWWLRGRILLGRGELEGALDAFERVLGFGKQRDFDPYAAYDERIFNTLSYESLATCCFRLGRYNESRRYYELAAACEPGRLDYRVKQALCARMARESGEPPRDSR
jgi:glycosyltransferase involved in cell wall biosynthesis